MRSLTWDDVRTRRLARNHLLQRAPRGKLVDVVHDVGGIHAQVMAAAELSLAARVTGITQQDVRDALWERRELVKAWTLRGTLHLHPQEELPLWMAAIREIGGGADELAGDRSDDVLAAIAAALDGRALLRAELAEAVVKRVGEWAREPLTSGWAHLLGPASVTGKLCHGPPQGPKITFVRADQWIGGWPDVDPREALEEVALRYLRTYGPATYREFRQWFGARAFTPKVAREFFETLDLVDVEVEGAPKQLPRGDTSFPKPKPSVRLLPEYDAYVMGFRERDEFVPEAARERVAAHNRGRYEGPAATPFLLVDGVVAGLWRRERRGKRLGLEVETTRKLTAAERRGAAEEAERIGEFLGTPVDVELR